MSELLRPVSGRLSNFRKLKKIKGSPGVALDYTAEKSRRLIRLRRRKGPLMDAN
jgi:hypothetical protein